MIACIDGAGKDPPARQDGGRDDVGGAFDAFLASALRARFPSPPPSPELLRLAQAAVARQH